jgi:hypothetical protein
MATPDGRPEGPEPGQSPRVEARHIPAVALIHQEGVIAVIALVGLSFRDGGLLAALTPPIALAKSILWGVALGAAAFFALWAIRRLPPLRELERWQRKMVEGWTVFDALAVAVISGLAEEALIRVLLQPVIGLVPAAMLFAVLHVIPDRRLWLWPVLALMLGVGLGLLYEFAGYPAAAAAHVLMNGLSLLRLRQPAAD